ncbi:MAG: hypothetical protein QOD00_1698 [Blastocatellia bacterium]|jgi:hypothetical protein|nr:hypothetical protein [Blastocatellia bacterium]
MRRLRVAAKYLDSSVAELWRMTNDAGGTDFILRACAYAKAEEEGEKLRASIEAQRAEVHG